MSSTLPGWAIDLLPSSVTVLAVFAGAWLVSRRFTAEQLWGQRRHVYGDILGALFDAQRVLDRIKDVIVAEGPRYQTFEFGDGLENTYQQAMDRAEATFVKSFVLMSSAFEARYLALRRFIDGQDPNQDRDAMWLETVGEVSEARIDLTEIARRDLGVRPVRRTPRRPSDYSPG